MPIYLFFLASSSIFMTYTVGDIVDITKEDVQAQMY